jgi:dienelactone hydrolase
VATARDARPALVDGSADSGGGSDSAGAGDDGRVDAASLADRAIADRTAGLDRATGVDSSSGGDAGSGAGVDPSGGSGGSAGPGGTADFACSAGSGHVYVRVPTSYGGAASAAPVIWLFNEEFAQWQAIADAEAIVLVDLDEYNDVAAYVDKLNCAQPRLEAEYNVDRARYHLAGWSAGGNLAVMLGAQNQDFAVSTLVFPGTGGQGAYDDLAAWTGHKLRLYYACGDQDPSFSWTVVQNEASAFAGLGYSTRFDVVTGCGHYIDEATYHVRRAAWDWVQGFTLRN